MPISERVHEAQKKLFTYLGVTDLGLQKGVRCGSVVGWRQAIDFSLVVEVHLGRVC